MADNHSVISKDNIVINSIVFQNTEEFNVKKTVFLQKCLENVLAVLIFASENFTQDKIVLKLSGR